MKVREAREKELELLKAELKETMEREMETTLKSEVERKTQELEQEYQERAAKHESETQMLKKALLEHGRQRVY